MQKLLTIRQSEFLQTLAKNFELEQDISSLDIFDSFAQALAKDSNLLSQEALKVLIFKQFKDYCNLDKTVTAVAKNVSDIQSSTEAAISAIDNNDSKSLKDAYAQLKTYQERILKLEESIYTDETTGVYNRKYLSNHELDEEGRFKYDGSLLHIKVNNFADINRNYGHEAGDTVLKFVSNLLEKHLRSIGVSLIRYIGVEFIAVPKAAVSKKADKIFSDTLNLILSKKFKTHDGEVLNIELEYTQVEFKKEQSFQEIYEDI